MSRPGSHVGGRGRTTGQVIRELWASRRVLGVLIRRDLKVRYADSMLGYLWTVLEPLMMSLIYWLVFTQIFHRSVGEDPYIIFLLAGMLPWMWFTTALTDGAKSLRSQRKLIASTSMPRQIWVLRSLGAKTVEFLLTIPVFVLFLLIYMPTGMNWRMVLIPVGFVLEIVLLLGLGLLLAPITMIMRDVEPLIRIFTRAFFYLSPIIYALGDVLDSGMPEAAKILFMLNPIAGILQCFRAGFFHMPLHGESIAVAAVIAVVTLVVGWMVFTRMERRVLKEI